MGDLCRLFSRSTELNISIYVLVALFVAVAGGLWIYALRLPADDRTKPMWKDRAMIVAVGGIITVAALWAINMVRYEVAFNKKCDALERYLMRQKAEISAKLDPKNITGNASRVVAESLANEFKSQFGRAILDQLKKEVPALTAVLQQQQARK